MAQPLIRYQQTGNFHTITFSCFHRKPYLGSPTARDLFERSLETIRLRYSFHVIGYVVMPEHVHLLVSEPQFTVLAKAIQALKLSVAVQRHERPFWQARYYDFNVWSERKRIEQLRYIHRNPVARGLVPSPNSGDGPASATTSQESPEPWRSNPSGPPGNANPASYQLGAPRLASETWVPTLPQRFTDARHPVAQSLPRKL
jgi:putative transposase